MDRPSLRYRFWLPLLVCAAMLAGCSGDVLYSQLDEQQANDVVAALVSNQINAEKKPSEHGDGFQVLVDHSEIPAAVLVLRDAGLPHPSEQSYADFYKKSSMIPDPAETKQRLTYIRQQDLDHALRQIDGVIEANVYLSIPEKDPNSDTPPVGSAAVMIVTRPNANTKSLEANIKSAIMAANPDLTDSSRVTVQFFPRPPSDIAPVLARAGQASLFFRGGLASWLLIGFGALAIILAGTLLWRNRDALFGRPERLSSSRAIIDDD